MALSTMLDSAWPISSRLPSITEPRSIAASSTTSRFLGHRLIELDHVADRRGQIDLDQRLGRIAGLEPGDHQDGVERLDQLIGFGDRAFERLAISGFRGIAGQRRLRPVAQPGQRRLQVVGDVVRDLPQPFVQIGDAGQHGVEVFRQPVELVAGAGHRQAPDSRRP